MNTKFEIKKVGGGHKVCCYRYKLVKRNKDAEKRPAWAEEDSKVFKGDGSRQDAREYGRNFVRECE